MLTSPTEVARRVASRVTHRLHSLPILALSVHSACNCRCVMCDIWKANAEKREISVEDLERHVASIRALHVQRVMLTGGEPLLHRNLWALCDRLREEDIRLTLVTTGLLVEQHAAEIARTVDEVVISVDGPREIHDAIRRVPGGFDKIARGVTALRSFIRARVSARPHLIARCVLQHANFEHIAATIDVAGVVGVDQVSFLAADVSSAAFNRPAPWSAERQAEIALAVTDLPAFERSIRQAEQQCADALQSGFVVGGRPALSRIYEYYAALNGRGEFPAVACNAPWVSAVLEPGGTVRPCFFQPAYETGGEKPLAAALNSAAAIAMRRRLDTTTNAICRRCVCSLALPLTRSA